MIRNLQVLAIALLVSSVSLAFGQVEVDDAKDSKAAVLYQPAEAQRLPFEGRSNITPSVCALAPKARAIREANPYPIEAPITNTFLGPDNPGCAAAISTCSFTC